MAACSEAFAVLYSFLQLAQAFVRAFSLPLSALAQALSLSLSCHLFYHSFRYLSYLSK